MVAISAELVKTLRERTGAGMMDCKEALVEAKGSLEAAVEVLRKRGLKDISKRAGKIAAEGVLGVYVHPGEQVVAVVELNCETDFVARNEEFRNLARNLAMQVAAMRPLYVAVEDIPPQILERETEILKAQLTESQLAKADKIIPGRLEKYYEDNVLYCQIYVKDESGKLKVKDLVDGLSAKMGEKIVVRRFQRFEVGEGIEKRVNDLAAEVARMVPA